MIAKLYILQSLRTTDPLPCGKILRDRIDPILPTYFAVVTDATTLFHELRQIKDDILSLCAPAVIHFDCHGNEDGIGLYDHQDKLTMLSWEDFRATFRDIYTSALVKPLVSFSSCKGLNIMQLIAQYEPCPYEAIAGCLVEIGFQDSVDGFYLFYTEIHAGTRLVDAVVQVEQRFPQLRFFAAPAMILAELGWIKYKQIKLTAEVITKRKADIIAQITAIQGGVTPHQIAMLDALITSDSGDRDQQRHMNVFNT
jgi:hypothetical protein